MANILRIPLKEWKWHSDEFLGTLIVYSQIILMRPEMMWNFLFRNSMLRPERVGQVRLAKGIFPLWLYKGHLWATSKEATNEDIVKKAAKIKPRYNPKDQLWWGFTDPSLRGLMENMGRAMLGLKQKHEQIWKSLSPQYKRRTRSKAGQIGVRDNRHIPQWVKIHVVLRDKGRCVYCGEDDPKELEFDHRRAWSKGGSSKDPLNICLGCKGCNRSKGDRDWGWG